MRHARWIRRRRPLRPWAALAAVGLVLTVVVSGCTGSEPVAGPPPDEAGPTPQSDSEFSDADLWLSFEDPSLTNDGETEYPDALGGAFGALVVTANDGDVEVIQGVDGAGDAVAFPEKCTAPQGCPRAMLEISPHPALNPGESAFEYGAAVWLAPDQATTGSNILQKGRFATEGGLWKLQVDTEDGLPSCVVRSGEDLVTVRAKVSIADSSWHRVVCRRDAKGVSIGVDGTVRRVGGSTGSVNNDWPIRVGSPGVGDKDDQFHGRIDDVYLKVDP